MKDITKQAVEKIKQQQLKPISKNFFVVKGILWWLAFGWAVFFGALSLAIAVFLVDELDWDVYRHAGDSFLEFLIISIPHLWVVFVVFFAFVSYRNLRSTEQGYKYRSLSILTAVVFLSCLFGFVFNALGVSKNLNEIFLEKIPGYGKVVQTKQAQWSQPQQGLLGGEIVGLADDGNFFLADFDGQQWWIKVNNQTLRRGAVVLEEAEKIKIIGRQEGEENIFNAQEIRPWEGRGKMQAGSQREEQNQRKGLRKK